MLRAGRSGRLCQVGFKSKMYRLCVYSQYVSYVWDICMFGDILLR
jgi:hypothetical protein